MEGTSSEKDSEPLPTGRTGVPPGGDFLPPEIRCLIYRKTPAYCFFLRDINRPSFLTWSPCSPALRGVGGLRKGRIGSSSTAAREERT